MAQLVRAHLGDPGLADADDRFGQAQLSLDQLVERLLERAGAHEGVDLDVARLADAEGAIGGLILDGRVPPAVEVEDVVRPGQVQAGAARTKRQHEHGRSVPLRLKPSDHSIALGHGRPAVQKEHLAVERVRQVVAEQRSHLRILCEDERALVQRNHLAEHVDDTLELAAAIWQTASVVEEQRRVVAHLLQPGKQREDLAATLDALGRGDVVAVTAAPPPRTGWPARASACSRP